MTLCIEGLRWCAQNLSYFTSRLPDLKNFLIIYDDDTDSRRPIQEYWIKSNVVDFIDRKMAQSQDLIPQNVKLALRMTDTLDIVKETHGKH